MDLTSRKFWGFVALELMAFAALLWAIGGCTFIAWGTVAGGLYATYCTVNVIEGKPNG